jgi:hypothetical protein
VASHTDIERLNAELDDPFTPLLLAMADWYEENDQPKMARAYRRIASEGKVPDILHDSWRWLQSDNTNRYFLPTAVFEEVHRRAGGSVTSLSVAYHSLAQVYAELDKE